VLIDTSLVGGAVVSANGVSRADVRIAHGRIAEVTPPSGHASGVSVDAFTIAPGFIDLQVNGAAGVDLATEPGRVAEVAAALPAFGVTSFLPTLVSSPTSQLDAALAVDRAVPVGCAKVLGWHLEGPVIAPSRRGTHDVASLAQAGAVDMSRWCADTGVRVVTVAPELGGALDVVRRLAGRGVTVSLGHTDCDAAMARAAIDAGASMVTHLFNAMVPLSHREPGIIGVALTDDRVTCGVIADGVHVHPMVLDLVWRCAGPDRVVVVSDAIAAAGRGDGSCRLGEVEVTVVAGVARNADGALAGSVAMLDHGVRTLVRATGAPLAVILRAVTTNPARVIACDGGTLRPGAPADVVLLDAELQVAATLVDGVVAHDPRGLFGRPFTAGTQWR
jgi:N-acetylglucosamine-6-phosphate deacetylase